MSGQSEQSEADWYMVQTATVTALLKEINDHYTVVCEKLGRRLAERVFEKSGEQPVDPVNAEYREVWYGFAKKFICNYWTLQMDLKRGFEAHAQGGRSHGEPPTPEELEDIIRVLDGFIDTVETARNEMETAELAVIWNNSPNQGRGL